MPWTKKLRSEENQVDKIEIQYDSLAVSLSPMVKRILIELGEALWGKRYFVGNFQFQNYEKHGHITWKIAKGWICQASTDHAEVMLSKNMQQFYVCCSDFDHRNCCTIDSGKLSEHALTESLIKACNKKNWGPQKSNNCRDNIPIRWLRLTEGQPLY